MSINKSFSTETSERYSRALFEVTSEADELESVENNVKNFQALFESNSEIRNFLLNPTQSIKNQNIFTNLLSEKLNFTKNLKNFFLLLNFKRRIFFVNKILKSFLNLCSKKRGEVSASLISSKELNQKQIDEISLDLSNSLGSKIKFDYVIGSDLMWQVVMV